MSKLTTLVLVIATALGVGCTGRGTVSTGVYASSGGGYYSSGYVDPSLVEIESGVWVVEGYDQPVFYSDSYYWLYRDGVWLRSSYYNRGFVVVRTIPYRVRTIRTPTAYVRYRATYGMRVRQGPRGQVIVRDHRTPYAQQRQEQIRENRQDMREQQQERREDIRENRQERQEEIRENRQEHQQDIRENRQEARERQQEVRENKQENKQEAREAQREKREQAARDRKKDEDDKKRPRRP